MKPRSIIKALIKHIQPVFQRCHALFFIREHDELVGRNPGIDRSRGVVVRISDSGDGRLSPYTNIREKDLVGRQQRFIAEGKVVLNVLFSAHARFETESLLVLDNRLNGLQEQFRHLPAGVTVYSVPQSVMDEVAGFHVHRGILAVGRRKAQPTLSEMIDRLPETALVVLLCGISNHDNIGSIFRNAAAFEADCVLLDETCCDPLYRKAIRVSVGATLKMPYFHGSISPNTTNGSASNRSRVVKTTAVKSATVQRMSVMTGMTPGLPSGDRLATNSAICRTSRTPNPMTCNGSQSSCRGINNRLKTANGITSIEITGKASTLPTSPKGAVLLKW